MSHARAVQLGLGLLGVPSELEEVPWLEKPTGRDDLLRALVNLPSPMTPIAILNS
jgi:hypothetical protein